MVLLERGALGSYRRVARFIIFCTADEAAIYGRLVVMAAGNVENVPGIRRLIMMTDDTLGYLTYSLQPISQQTPRQTTLVSTEEALSSTC